MLTKEKIAISISWELLEKIDSKVDKINFKNRSHVIESLVREWMKLRQDLASIIIANERNWNDWEYSLDIPKSLIKIDGKTLIEKQLEMLKKANIEKCVIAVWFMWSEVKSFLKKKNFWMDIEFVEFDEHDQSWRIINECSKNLKSNKVLVMLWDNYFHWLNLTDFIYYHNTNSQDLSIIVKTIEASDWYWNIKLEGNNIVRFVEKPLHKEDISFIINAWVYLISNENIPDINDNYKIESDFFPKFVRTNSVKAYFHNWKWFHMQDNKTLNLFN